MQQDINVLDNIYMYRQTKRQQKKTDKARDKARDTHTDKETMRQTIDNTTLSHAMTCHSLSHLCRSAAALRRHRVQGA